MSTSSQPPPLAGLLQQLTLVLSKVASHPELSSWLTTPVRELLHGLLTDPSHPYPHWNHATNKSSTNPETSEHSQSQMGVLGNLLSGTTQDLLIEILSNPALKLERTTTYLDAQRVLPLMMELSKSKVGTLEMRVKLSLELKIVPQIYSEEPTQMTLDLESPLSESELSSLKQEQTVSGTTKSSKDLPDD